MLRYLPLLFCVLSINLNALECTSIRANGPNGWGAISQRNENGALSGIAVEVAEKVFSQLAVKLKLGDILPWKRQQYYLETGEIDLVIAAYYNDDRAKIFSYSDPYHTDDIRVFVHKDRLFDFKNLHSLKGKLGLRPLGGTYGNQFDKFAVDHLNIEEYFYTEYGMKRLHSKRVDFLVLALLDGLLTAKKYGISANIVPLPKNVTQLPIHFLLSNKSPCIKLLERINHILTELKASHFIKNLEKKYLRQLNEF